jgi:hypothetical protein
MHLWATVQAVITRTVCRGIAGQRHRDMTMYTIRSVRAIDTSDLSVQGERRVDMLAPGSQSPSDISHARQVLVCSCWPCLHLAHALFCHSFSHSCSCYSRVIPLLADEDDPRRIACRKVLERLSKELCERDVCISAQSCLSSAHSLTLTLSRRDGADFILDLWSGVHYQDSLVRPHQVP